MRLAWVPTWTAILEHRPGDELLGDDWIVEVEADGSWAIFNWLGDEVGTGRARSPNAAKTEALGAFAQIADWMEGAKYEAQLPDGQLKLAIYWPIASGGQLNWMALVEHGGKCTRQDGSERTLRKAKAACKAAVLKLLPGS